MIPLRRDAVIVHRTCGPSGRCPGPRDIYRQPEVSCSFIAGVACLSYGTGRDPDDRAKRKALASARVFLSRYRLPIGHQDYALASAPKPIAGE